MTDNKEPKVTECWAAINIDGAPMLEGVAEFAEVDPIIKERQCILLWRKDYDAIRKELEELRQELKQTKIVLRNCLVELGFTLNNDTEAHDDKKAK